jgi:hypothetical protein
MKPVKMRIRKSDTLLQAISTGPIVARVSGSVKRLGSNYRDAVVMLYNKANLQLIAIKKPDENGNYQFSGLNTDLKTFIVAFDQKQQFNAVIQDNVVPK